ncbi:MAG: succinate dehydrogenase cytochrome b subunit [Chthoniobacteraceae bacterium]|jgi:succinate dehydrogenase / fumarate reductase cytochrome b subunit
MSKATFFWQSSIGKKWIVALTGIVLVAYVLGHLAGNLQIFLPDRGSHINAYGAFLHSLGAGLWAIRAFLLACFIIHIVVTIQLAIQNRRARPDRYAAPHYRKADWASRSMVMSGLIVLCFIIFHILHFTTLTIRPDFANLKETLPNGAERHNVYAMVVEGFQQPAASCFYILGMILLCMHLSHGFGSLVQTFGLNSTRIEPWLINGGRILAIIICLGYISIPIAVMTGILHL